MSLVELLVGLAVGLFIVSTAIGLAVGQLREDRALLQESRLLLNLQTAADLITRDLRRAGYQGDAGAVIAREGSTPIANPYDDLSLSGYGSDSMVLLNFSPNDSEKHVVESNERFGFRVRAGAVEMMVGEANWQAVTDSGALNITTLSLTPIFQDIALGSFCEQPCPSTNAGCPHQQVRSFELELVAQSTTDAAVRRALKSSVRVRNDAVRGACPA